MVWLRSFNFRNSNSADIDYYFFLYVGLLLFNFCRNAALEKQGFKQPKALKTGTTIAGIIFKVNKTLFGLNF